MDRKHVSSLVLKKLSDLLVYASLPFIGLEDQLEAIESKLRDIVNSEFFDCENEFLYELEDIIDFLAANKTSLPISDQRKLRKKLNRIKLQISEETHKVSTDQGLNLCAPWVRKQLDVGESVVSPVIKKVTALANRIRMSRATRRRARWVRDDLRFLHVIVKESEWGELGREQKVWMEELCLFCRSADDVIGSFLSSRINRGRFKNLCLAFAPYKFMSDRKIRRNLNLMNAKLKNLIRSFRLLATKKPIPTPRVPPNAPPLRYPRNPPPGDAISLSSLDDDNDGNDDDDDDDDAENGIQQHAPQDEQTRQPFDANDVAEQPNINGCDCNLDEIMGFLLKDDPNCLTVSIVGMEGIGKTKLARSIYENSTVRDHFPHRSWIDWVRETNLNLIMQQILGAPYMNMMRVHSGNREDYFAKVRNLLDDFLMGKRYLIVIDEVPSSRRLYKELGAVFDGLLHGTRIICVASKVEATQESHERNFTCRLHLWSDDESWALFVSCLKLNANITSELLELKKKEILRVCGGLPKAIVKLAQLLGRETTFPEDWWRVLETFNKDEGTWSRILQDINETLPLYLRRCLYYFQLFPDNYEIPVRRLIGLWVAEGFGYQKNGKSASPEQVLEEFLMELVNRNMIQVTTTKANGKIKACRLPDALRVHWLLKHKEANSHIDDNVYSSSGAIGRLVDHLEPGHPSFDHIHGDSSTCPSSLYQHYRGTVSFLSFDTRQGSKPGEDVGNFLQKCISSKCFSCLWVLDLENVFKPKLPKAIAKLTRLKYLGLRYTYLEILPLFINKLLKLQTLDLKHTHINTLPSSIWMMKHLRHLFLNSSSCCALPPPPKRSCLADIQTLWGAFVNEDSSVRDGLDTLLQIRTLSLICKISDQSRMETMSSQLDAAASWISMLNHLQTLKLKSFNESGEPWDICLESLSGNINLSSINLVGNLKYQHLISELPENLMELNLSSSGLAEDPMRKLENLPNLRNLTLSTGAFTGTKMVCSSGGLPKLQVLKLSKLEALEEWDVEEGAMSRLKCLEIISCRNFQKLPDGLQYIKSLSKLKLADMPVLVARINDNQDEECKKIAHVLHVYT